MEKTLANIWRRGLRFAYGITGLRPTSYPYISGDGFRALAHHIHDAHGEIRPKTVRAGDIVFVESRFIERHFAFTHGLIEVPYVLITHNGDANIGSREAALIDEKILCWFAQNVVIEHPKLVPIPIGVENARLAGAGRRSALRRLEKDIPRKNGRMLAAFTAHTNPEARNRALEELRENPLADIQEVRMSQESYASMLRQYSHVASPPGNGIDCHRTWEALYARTIPVVQPSVCMKYFRDIGVPVLIQDSWRDIQARTMPDISDPKTSPIFFNYWKQLISARARTHEKD
jgi:hypothetical protein